MFPMFRLKRSRSHEETPKNSPMKHGFQNVNLVTPASNSMGISRRSSVSSVTSDTSSLFPIYESPSNLYHLQSDIDQSASEIDENIGPQLDRVTKDQLYSAYRKVSAKYHKYRGRYTDLVAHYRELERAKTKLESVLVETQDKVLRKIADLKEQCQLEQQAKAHLEEVLRTDIEEKDHIISTLNTKVKLLQANGPSFENSTPEQSESKENAKVDLIDLSNDSSNNANESSALTAENAQLKEKLKKLESVVLKYKDLLKRSKTKFTDVMEEKGALERDHETFKSSAIEKAKILGDELTRQREEIVNLTDQVTALKKREEECAISLAENKLSIHRELEGKEEQIKQLRLDLKQMTESKENFREAVEKYRTELEKLRTGYETDACANAKPQKDVHDGNSDSKNYDANRDSNSLTEKEAEQIQIQLQGLQVELSTLRNENRDLRNESEANKIVADERRRETDSTIQNLQATIHSLDKEVENMRDALTDRDRVCETYKSKMQEYISLLEKSKEQLLAQESEMKDLRSKVEEIEGAKMQELDNSAAELSKIRSELESYKQRDNALNSLVAIRKSVTQLKNDWHSLKNITREHILSESNFMQIATKSIEDELQNKLKTYENRLNNQTNLEAELTYTKKLLEETTQRAEQFDQLNMTNSKLAAEIENFKSKIRDLESVRLEAETMREENRNLTTELKELGELKVKYEQASKAVELLTSANEENVNFGREIHSLRSEIADLTNVITHKEEEIKTLAERLSNEESNVAKIVELEQRITILKDVELKHNDLIKETEVLKQNLTDSESVIRELAELKLKYDEAMKTVESLKLSSEQSLLYGRKIEELNSVLDELRNQLAKKEEEIQVIRTEASELQEKNKNLQETISAQNVQVKKLKATKDRLNETVQEMKSAVNKLQTENCEMESLKQTNSSMEQQISEMLLENKDLKEKQNELTKSNEKLNKAAEILKLKLNDYEVYRQKIVGDLENLKEQLAESEELKIREEELQKVRGSLVLENSELTKRIAVLEETYKNEMQIAEEVKEDLRQKLEALKDAESKSQEFCQEIERLNAEISKAQSASMELSELRTKYEEAEKTIAELRSANAEYVQFEKELKGIREEMAKKNEEVQNLNEKLCDMERQMEKLKQEWEINSKSLNEQVIEMTEKNKNLDIQKKTKNAQLFKLMSVKDNQAKIIQETTEELNETKSQNTKLIEQVDAYIKEIEVLKSANSQIDTLRELNSSVTSQLEQITTVRDQISTENTELKHIQQTHLSKIQASENQMTELREQLDLHVKQNEALLKNVAELTSTVESLQVVEDQNKVLIETIACFKGTEDTNSKLTEELKNLKENIARGEELKIEKDRLQVEKDTELQKLKQINTELQTYIDELQAKLSTIESQRDIEIDKLRVEVNELKAMTEEKQTELKLLDTKNTELLREMDKMNALSSEAINECTKRAEDLANTVKLLEQKNTQLQLEVDELSKSESKSEDANSLNEDTTKLLSKLQRENKKLEAQLDEALITFQSKESQMQAANNESKMYAEKLKEELKTHDEEQNMRLKQLVKEFQAQLQDKEEELQAALEKRFDRQKNYESDLIQQYKEQLKDFQVELTAKSEQIESLIIDNKDLSTDKANEISRLTDTINQIKKDHANEMQEIERKWKTVLQQRIEKLENKHEEEINELTREWRNERRPDTSDSNLKELESTSRVAMAAVQSNTGSFHTLQQTLASQKRELTELRKLVKLRQDTLEDSTEIEYLRNILFEYMMGRETMVLARVIAAVVKFDQQQTAKILKKEEDKLTLLGSLGLT